MQGSPPQTSTLVSIPGNASPRSRTTHCKTWAFSARLSFERSVSTSRSGLMMRHTPGEAVHMLETSRITLHHQERSFELQSDSQCRAHGQTCHRARKAALDLLPRFQGGSVERFWRSPTLAKALSWVGGLTAVFGMGTGVTPAAMVAGKPAGAALASFASTIIGFHSEASIPASSSGVRARQSRSHPRARDKRR